MLLLTIEHGELCVGSNRKPICKAGAGNERTVIPAGRYEVSTQFSHAHGDVLPNAVGLGWLGPNPRCDVVLGNVRGRNGIIPSPAVLGALLAKLEVAENYGQAVILEVR